MIVKQNFDLTEYNSYRISATCAEAIFPQTEDDLQEIYSNNKTKIILGGGYNVILSKNHYDETFVIFDHHFSSVKISDNKITAQSGLSMLKLSILAQENGLSGAEVFYDIPSSLGGAVVMNAGAGGEEIKDLLTNVKYFDPLTLTFSEKLKQDIDFEYRNSFFQKNPHFIITEATLEFNSGNKDAILERMEQLKAVRWSKQPKEYPNGGSVFKRPPGRYVGPMIDELGLKGYTVGGAQVSVKHGGFIINHNNSATGEDILAVIKHVKDQVFERFEVDLEIEQRII